MEKDSKVKAKVTVEQTNNFTHPAYSLVHNADGNWEVIKVLIDPVTKVASPAVEVVDKEREKAFGIERFQVAVGKFILNVRNS